jgi:hypothetical protein
VGDKGEKKMRSSNLREREVKCGKKRKRRGWNCRENFLNMNENKFRENEKETMFSTLFILRTTFIDHTPTTSALIISGDALSVNQPISTNKLI